MRVWGVVEMMDKMMYDKMCTYRTEKALRVKKESQEDRGWMVNCKMMAEQQFVVVDGEEQEMYRVMIFKQGKQFRGMGARDRGRV